MSFQALLDHTKAGLSGAEVVVVVSNVANVKGLQRAQEAGVATKVRSATAYNSSLPARQCGHHGQCIGIIQ